MRIYAIRDEEMRPRRNLAYLFYYEKEKQFYIEIPEQGEPWDLPMILFNFAQKGKYTVDAKWSMAWVQQRIIPPDRQNLGQILRDNGMTEYDEYKLLMLCHGRCAQDSCYLKEIGMDQLPSEIIVRLNARIYTAVPLRDNRLMVFFRDGHTRICDIADIEKDNPAYRRLLAYHEAFKHARVLAGGYGVGWDNGQSIDDQKLRKAGISIPMTYTDFRIALGESLIDTAGTTRLLGCSRQYVNALVRDGRLQPLLQTDKSTIFLRSDLQQWDIIE